MLRPEQSHMTKNFLHKPQNLTLQITKLFKLYFADEGENLKGNKQAS